MKNLRNCIMLGAMLFSFTSCFNEPIDTMDVSNIENDPLRCFNEIPKAKIRNNSNYNVDFEMYDDDGVLVNFVYGTLPGEVSIWSTFPVGEISFIVSTPVSTKTVDIDMSLCMSYDVTIDANNQLDTDKATVL